jgi:hypothetical protein
LQHIGVTRNFAEAEGLFGEISAIAASEKAFAVSKANELSACNGIDEAIQTASDALIAVFRGTTASKFIDLAKLLLWESFPQHKELTRPIGRPAGESISERW